MRGTPKRVAPLARGSGQGGGAQPSKMEEDLEEKKIQIERLSAKLEHSEHILNQMIQASTGRNLNHQNKKKHHEVPQVRGGEKSGRRGGGGVRRYLAAASGSYDDY